ncbi:MAG: DUF4252 domain-containing protein [Ignavibacteriae bacterium]|nr:DUF4252 domain-containing protein [Ignavibacteriota bacterium]MCB9208484.1 DUF4252 domain-containing protein [Ignavibacteriales bacterium]MCB9258407.1 DUF4252 domain-containing protein [Ignavibacteriales bacterium]
MKKLISLISIIMLFAAANIMGQEEDYSKYPGFANFGDLSGMEDGEQVTEILIEEKLLRMVSKFTKDDVELSDLIGGLKLIKVNTFEVTPSNSDQLMKRAQMIDKDLMGKKWDRIVKTKSRGEVANVYIKTAGDDEFVGLTVVSIDEGGEAAFVNIVGSINMDALGKLGQKFDIPGIGDIKKDSEK